MTDRPISLLDTVALLKDAPDLGLAKGQVGAVVEELDASTVLIEFVGPTGDTFALVALPRSDLLRLAYEQQAAE